jgi:hypothetical protein
MVTAAFTIFWRFEPFFIRILAAAASRCLAPQGNLDFCAMHNILKCIAQGRPGLKGVSTKGSVK